MVRVPMPALTEERRRDLIKVIKHEGENARSRCATRAATPTRAQGIAESKSVSEDEERRAQEEIQKLTDKHIADIDKMIAAKEAELMAV